MKSVGLSLEHDPAALSPIHERIVDSPALEREIVLGGQSADGVETITSFVEGDISAYEPVLEARETVHEYDVTPSEEGFFLYLRRDLESEGLSLMTALAQETVVVVPPIEVRADRTIRLTIVGHPSGLTVVLETPGDGVTVDVRWTSDSVTVSETRVSDRQLAALETARELGYYEIPRRNGIEVVADDLGCAVSTASELLRRGEANAVERMLEDSR